MLRFALCADDYAITPAVSRGILELLAARRLTAVSVMVTQPEWQQAAAALRPFAASADIGLHFNLTLGSPSGAMPGLAPSGRFPVLRNLVRGALLGRLSRSDIAAEAGRQIDGFAQYFGRLPDFVDGHQHVHALPVVRAALLRTLAEQALPGRLWLRDPGDRLPAMLARPLKRKALTVATLTAGFAERSRTSGFGLNRGFAGFSDFNPAADYAALFATFLRAAGPRHLVMCHPGYADARLAELDPATKSRENELAFLLSPAFPEMLAKHSAELMRLSEEPGSH